MSCPQFWTFSSYKTLYICMVHFTCQRKLTDVFSFTELFDLYFFFFFNFQTHFMLVADSQSSAPSQPLWTLPVSPAARNQRVYFPDFPAGKVLVLIPPVRDTVARFGRWWRNRSHGVSPWSHRPEVLPRLPHIPLWITHTGAPGSWDHWWWGFVNFYNSFKAMIS